MIKIDILQEHDNKLLKRKDLLLIVDHVGQPTPKKSELEEKIAEQFKVERDKVEIIYIFSEKGRAASKVKAKIWDKPVKKEEKKEEKAEKQDGENETQTN